MDRFLHPLQYAILDNEHYRLIATAPNRCFLYLKNVQNETFKKIIGQFKHPNSEIFSPLRKSISQNDENPMPTLTVYNILNFIRLV